MHKRIWTLASLLIVAAMFLAACGGGTEAPAAPEEPAAKCEDELGRVEIKPGEPVHIAYALTVSGATAPLGEDSKGAIEIAIE